MANSKKKYSAEEKGKIALEALKGIMTVSQIASKYKVHPTQINGWKKRLKESLPEIFSRRKKHKKEKEAETLEELYRIIGHQKTELEWVKKKAKLFGN